MSSLLSVGNRKLKKSGDKHNMVIASFGLPAGPTCPGALQCKSACYAQSGMYLFKAVRESRQRNFEATQSETFVADISLEIDKLDSKHADKITAIRIHDSGDFYNKAYLNKWVEVALKFDHVIFYAYTKSVNLFKGVVLPENFKVIFSLGGKYDASIVQLRNNHAKVFETREELLKAGYVDASEDDTVAIFGGRKIGLVYHHAKNYNNSEWSKVV